jgi:nicotinamide riboside kinase
MKIAITGAQSTGKSTLLHSIKNSKLRDTVLPNYVFNDELTRKINQKGVTINEQGNNLTQLLTINVHVSNIIQDKFVSDRCIIDACCYTHWLYQNGKVDEWVMDYSTKVLQQIIFSYDYIFYLPNELPLQDDGVRSANKSFRDEIVHLFEYYIDTYNLPVVTLTGTVEQRTNKFFNTLCN